MSFAPTLVVGVGGTGSKVARKIYEKVPADKRKLVQVLAFDTNVNDLEENDILEVICASLNS